MYKKEKVEALKPLMANLVVEVLLPKELVSKAGVITKSSEQAEKYFEGVETYHGKVLTVGPDVKSNINVGDCVVFDRLVGHGVPTEGDKHIKIIQDESIIMKKSQDESIKAAIPLHERVIVKLDKKEMKTESGVYKGNASVSNNIDVDTVPGTITAVSEGVTAVKKGDRVRVDAYAGIPHDEDNEEYKIISYHSILVTL